MKKIIIFITCVFVCVFHMACGTKDSNGYMPHINEIDNDVRQMRQGQPYLSNTLCENYVIRLVDFMQLDHQVRRNKNRLAMLQAYAKGEIDRLEFFLLRGEDIASRENKNLENDLKCVAQRHVLNERVLEGLKAELDARSAIEAVYEKSSFPVRLYVLGSQLAKGAWSLGFYKSVDCVVNLFRP